MSGLEAGKFQVSHRERGSLSEGDYFVLVPKRDPAAVQALRAYAKATTDPVLARELRAWADMDDAHYDDRRPPPRVADDVFDTHKRIPQRVAVWVETLAGEVDADRMNIRTALQRIVGFVLHELQG